MKPINAEAGYSLLETVVAMALFVGVLIPVAVLVGNFTLDKKAHHLAPALRLAQAEITRVVSDRDFTSGSESKDGFTVVRTVQKNQRLVRINVRIHKDDESGILLCSLNKSVLDYR